MGFLFEGCRGLPPRRGNSLPIFRRVGGRRGIGRLLAHRLLRGRGLPCRLLIRPDTAGLFKLVRPPAVPNLGGRLLRDRLGAGHRLLILLAVRRVAGRRLLILLAVRRIAGRRLLLLLAVLAIHHLDCRLAGAAQILQPRVQGHVLTIPQNHAGTQGH